MRKEKKRTFTLAKTTIAMANSILITGAGGFIGSFLVERALADGYEVWAGVRATTSRRWLASPLIHFIDLPFDRPAALAAALAKHRESYGPWTAIVHNLGVTKCRDAHDFERVNCGYVRHFVEALRAAGMMPRQFVLMSSLSAFGPVHEHDGRPLSVADEPHPNTAYGRSKLHAAQFVKGQADVPWLVFYPTGVYGPRERDYYLMFKTVRAGVDFVPGFAPQRITFIYVRDLVEAIFRSLAAGLTRREYIISEPRAYASTDFRRFIQRAMGRRFVLTVRVPLCLLKAVNYAAGWMAGLFGKASTLNADKYRIIAQRNWTCDITPLRDDLGFTPRWSLADGVGETYRWYKENGWL